ncbi:MAG TPA: glycosyl hydrolase [Longimicrobium sp.]|nr:glycosyl hydrolase [Longimicrobium sp.]
MKLSLRSSAALAVLPVLFAACADNPAGAGPSPEPQPPVTAPSGPFFAGAYLGDAATTPERVETAIADFASRTGKAPALVKSFHDLSCDFSATGWCGQLLRRIGGTGASSYVALDVRWPGGPRSGVLDPINAGQADAIIARVARQLAGVGSLVLLEPAWEMNGNWDYAWQGTTNGADVNAPAKYRAAWQRIVGIFRREGASNVRFVFNPNVGNPITKSATGASHWNWYANYYPGDEYVDYVGAHGFNAPKLWGGSWQSPSRMFDGDEADHMLSDLEKRYPNKPIIIGEFATAEGSEGQKAAWIRDAYALLRSHPRVVGAVWFDMNKEADWRIDSSAGALAAYRTAMAETGIQTAFRETGVAGATRLAAR